MNAVIERAARDYVRALARAENSHGISANTQAHIDAIIALHDLTLALGEPCLHCTDDTCPGYIGSTYVVDTPGL